MQNKIVTFKELLIKIAIFEKLKVCLSIELKQIKSE